MTLLLATLLSALPPVGPVPAWVAPVAVPALDPDGAAPLLVDDFQLRVGKTQERFWRRVWRVRTVDGLSAVAQHEFTWSPLTERLTLHGLWVWRDGQRRQAWHPDDARVLQREARLDEGIYDGRLTLRVELRDLRVGDLVEVASTTTGENPVFEGGVALRLPQWYPDPVARASVRLLWERRRPLAWKAHADATPPIVEGSGASTVYRWTLDGYTPPELVASVPADVQQVPVLEFSDWDSWAAVSTWAERLFVVPPPEQRLKRELARFRAMPEGDRVAAIVRFVQDDVRYVGVELGAHSHRPHSPAWVLERGFGDCKDKALLLVSLLRGVGLEAWPVLVNSARGTGLGHGLPGPHLFDHAIVRVDFPTGQRFIDATRTLQRGDPATWEDALYGLALVVRPGTDRLQLISMPDSAAPTWEVRQHWVAPSYDGNATLLVETVASGVEAALLRRAVNNRTRTELGESQRALRAERLEAELKAVGLEWEDEESAERFTLRERYEVTGFFDGRRGHQFHVMNLQGDLPAPPTGPRTLPLAQAHPTRVREVILYDGPDPLEGPRIRLENRTINHPAFSLVLRQQVERTRLSLVWTFATNMDRVAPADLASYATAVGDARGSFGYSVRHGSSGQGSGEGAPGAELLVWPLLAGLAILAIVVGVVRAERAAEGPSLRARFKTWRFKSRQRGSPGELPSQPVELERLEDAGRYLKSRVCPVGHAWPEGVVLLETVRLGEERISVVGRRCATCGASEHRYARVRQP